MKPEAPSTAPSSLKSDLSMDRPIMFRDGELLASLLREDDFRCSVCKNVLKEPVSISCGHSYCKTCIQTCWSNPTHAGSYFCPQCRKRFRTRPKLIINSSLNKVIQKLKQVGFSPALPPHCYAGPADVACDFCTERKLKAVKSCLTCSASYCENHVKQHYTVAALQRHILVEVTGDLEQRLCKLHQRALEVFCKTDEIYICVICAMDKHKEHETIQIKTEVPALQINTREDLPGVSFGSLSQMEKEIKHLIKENKALTEKVKRSDTELSYMAKYFCRGLEKDDGHLAWQWASAGLNTSFAKVSALGRSLDLGMLYDGHSDSFSSDALLWDEDTLSSMRLSLPHPHVEVKILESDSLKDRFRALDLIPPLRASVISGLVEVSGAAAFLKHPAQSHLKDRVTLHYRKTTRLDMLSLKLLHNGAPLSGIEQNTATHVVVAVLYGVEAFFIFDDKKQSSEGNETLKHLIKSKFISQNPELSSDQQSNAVFDCTVYRDVGDCAKSPMNFDAAVKAYSSLQNLSESEAQNAVPLKVWLCPLDGVRQMSALIVKDINEDILEEVIGVLEHLNRNISICQDMMSIYNDLGVTTWFPALREALSRFSSLIHQYQSEFQTELASCIKNMKKKEKEGEESLRKLLKTDDQTALSSCFKTLREREDDEEQNFRALLNKNDQSPFSPQNLHQWLLNKDAEVVALNECRAAKVTIVESSQILKKVIQKSDTVFCFALTSLESEDPFLLSLREHIDSVNEQERKSPFRPSDISQKIQSDLRSFLSCSETNANAEHTKFIVASIPEPRFSGSSIYLYLNGNIVSCNVRLDVKPEIPEIIMNSPKSIVVRLQRSESNVLNRFRVECRAVNCRGSSLSDKKWKENSVSYLGEHCEVLDLTPETQYQLRYALMDSNSMSDYSKITEFQTARRARPGQVAVKQLNKDSLHIVWNRPETDEDSPVLRYMVEFMEAGLEGWQSILTEGPECECTITFPYSICYKVRVSAVFGDRDTSEPSQETEVSVDIWYIDLSKRKASLFSKVLKLQSVKKPVELRDWSDKESEVCSFLQCLPQISQLRFIRLIKNEGAIKFLLKLFVSAAENHAASKESYIELLQSVCSYDTFPFDSGDLPFVQCDFLLDLYSHVKLYETETGRSVLPALQPVYQSAPDVWTIKLSERKASILLEVLKLQTEKNPVKLLDWSGEESEVRSFLQCLPHISQLRFHYYVWITFEKQAKSAMMFLKKLFVTAAECDATSGGSFINLVLSVCSYKHFPFHDDPDVLCNFLLDLYSQAMLYETETGKSVLPALQPVYQSAPEVWYINLSERKASILLEVLKLQTEKKPVELLDWSDEESEVRSFLQCLPHITQLSFHYFALTGEEEISAMMFLKKLFVTAAECDATSGGRLINLVLSVCSYKHFPFHDDPDMLCNFLLDLYSQAMLYETETGKSVLPALQPVYQSAPEVWYIKLSERKASILLEVLKLQTEKKPVELLDWSDEESEVRSFLQCLPHISQLRSNYYSWEEESAMMFLKKLFVTAAECDAVSGGSFINLVLSVCSYKHFPFHDDPDVLCNFLLDLYSQAMLYETETGTSVLPALQPVYQSAPDVWTIKLSERKASVLLEVLKLQTEKKPVKLRDAESEVRSFLQCLPHISQLIFITDCQRKEDVIKFLLKMFITAAECDAASGERFTEQLQSVCCYDSFPFDQDDKEYNQFEQCDFLLDLYSHVKQHETKTGRSVLPALQPVYQSAPDVWNIKLSDGKASVLLEVLKLQTEKKPVRLRDWSDEESEVRSFLQFLPHISQLRFDDEKEKTSALRFLKKLFVAAAECEAASGESFTEQLVSVWSCETFPFVNVDDKKYDPVALCDFLLDLYSHVKQHETKTGRSVLPALQAVYQSAPEVWYIRLSERKVSILLEVLKLQTEKKPVELREWSDKRSEVTSFLQCLPHISHLRFDDEKEKTSALRFLKKLFVAAAECEAASGESFTEQLVSVWSCETFPFVNVDDKKYDPVALCDFLLDLYSHVKQHETKTGRSVLPALQAVYQSAPEVWYIKLSERKASILLEVLKLQTEQKPVELREWSDKKSEVRSFLQCLPHISQLSFITDCQRKEDVIKFLLKMFITAAECDAASGESFTEQLQSVCCYDSFPFDQDDKEYNQFKQCDFLLDLYSHVKQHETKTGRSVLPALQPVYQSAPDVWNIKLSDGKTSVLLEVLKLQTEKRPVRLRDWSDEESEVRSFLQFLPHISQLSFVTYYKWKEDVIKFLLKMFITAAECDAASGESFTEQLQSVCCYDSFPFDRNDKEYYLFKQCDFLLDLYSHVKQHETKTSRSVLPALQPVYQSAPDVWTINLSERKASVLLEVLKLQTEKKPVRLRDWSDEESEVRSFLQCLPHISQLRGAEQYVPSLCKMLQCGEEREQVVPLLQALGFTISLGGVLPVSSCRAVGRVLKLSPSKLNLTLNPQAISLRGTRLLFRHITHLRTFSLSGRMVVRMVRAFRTMRTVAPVRVEELSLILNSTQQAEGVLSRVLSSLANLLRLCSIQCLNLTEYKIEAHSLTVLLCHQGPLTIRLSQETLQQLTVLVYEAQQEKFTQSFLQKVGGDFSSCSLKWEMIQYFSQYHTITADFRKSNVTQQNIRELVLVLDQVQLKRLAPSMVLSIMRQIYKTGSAHCVSSLLSSLENCISLNSRELDSGHCAALCFILQHCTAVSLNLLWASIPEGELERIVPLLEHVRHLSVDRLLLLRLLHCCSVSELHLESAATLLSALQHKLDFSCSSSLNLTADTETNTLLLRTETCKVISTVIQRANQHTQLNLHDCEIEEAGVQELITILHTVTLNCSKALLLQFLTRVHVGFELECVRRAVNLSKALGGEVNLSHTQLNLQACTSLALLLEYCEGLEELDLSHCQLTDHSLELLLPHLHKCHILDFSHNDFTDVSAKRIHDIVSTNSSIQIVRLFNNRIKDRKVFRADKQFEI